MEIIPVVIGYFDLYLIGALLILNLILWKIEMEHNLGCFVLGFLFGFILPFASIGVEVERATADREMVDNFELLYTYLRFPVYWFLGALQMIVLNYKREKREQDFGEE